MTALAVAGLVVAGVILLGYLVVANVSEARRADAGRGVWLACAAETCGAVPARALVRAPAVDSEAP